MWGKSAGMSSPFDLLLDPISLSIMGLYATLWLYETLRPGRPLPLAPGARTCGVLSFFGFFFLSSYLPVLWDAQLSALRLFDLQELPTWAGAALGLLSYEFVAYWYHRGLHSSNVAFRFLHQTHHSSERLDVPSSFYFHPLDMIGWTLVASLGLTLLVGLSPQATMVTLLTINALGIFQHANIKTPRWLGYIVQRPESHSLHHGRGYHQNNYADLPLMDLVFGTFENPRDFAQHTGFFPGASVRLSDLLLGRDLSRVSDLPEGYATAPREPSERAQPTHDQAPLIVDAGQLAFASRARASSAPAKGPSTVG